MLQHPLRRNCCGQRARLPRPRLSPIRPWPVVVKQNRYYSANGHHVEQCGNAHLKNQVDQRLDSDDHQEREHGTEEKDGGDNRPFRQGPKVTHRWTIAGLLTGAIVRRRPSKTRWPQARRGRNHVGGSAGLVALHHPCRIHRSRITKCSDAFAVTLAITGLRSMNSASNAGTEAQKSANNGFKSRIALARSTCGRGRLS
jgi:hypothetical protein